MTHGFQLIEDGDFGALHRQLSKKLDLPLNPAFWVGAVMWRFSVNRNYFFASSKLSYLKTFPFLVFSGVLRSYEFGTPLSS